MNSSNKKPLILLWILYVGFIFYGTLIPFDLNLTGFPENFKIPAQVASIHISKMDVISNFLLFIPLGWLSFFLLKDKRHPYLKSFVFVGVISFFLSFLVEALQQYSPSRSSWLGDVFLNGTSGLTGWFIAVFFYKTLYKFFMYQLGFNFREKPFWLLTWILGGALFFGALFPFDISIQISDLKIAVKSIHWIPFWDLSNPNYITSMFKDGLLFSLFAGLFHFSIRLYFPRVKSIMALTLFITLLLAGSIEIMQIFIVSRFTDTTDLILAFFGTLIGCSIAYLLETFLIWRPSTGKPPGLISKMVLFIITSLYTVFIYYYLLSPLIFEFNLDLLKEKFSWVQLVPLYAYWVRTDFSALQDLLITVFTYIPFGGLVTLLFRDNNLSKDMVLILSVMVAGSIEFLQYFQEGRYPDITDVLSGVVGAYLGFIVIQSMKTSQENVQNP